MNKDKKKYAIAMRRLYSTNIPSKGICELLGVDKCSFVKHINKYLVDGMTLENFGSDWGLDHIVPVELFDKLNSDELKLCYNFNNIMPMFNVDNRLKGASIHFSLLKLNSMYTNVYIEKLKEKCTGEINNRYIRYLI